MEITFHGKRALVTGASRGIGFGIALSLARGGADVIGLARDVAPLEAVKLEHPELRIRGVSCDLHDWSATRKCVSELGDFDLLVNNAGTGVMESFLDVTPDTVDTTFNINVKAVINVSQIVVQSMIARGRGGSIVHVSSQASQRALDRHTVYCASKAALDSLGRSMALELGRHRIRVNCVNPTVVMTELGARAWSDEATAGPMRARLPLGKFAAVDDVVAAVLFLLSDQSAMTTGSTLPVEGGFWAG